MKKKKVMPAEISCFHSAVFIDYMEKNFPSHDILEGIVGNTKFLIDDHKTNKIIPVTKEFLLDKNNWYSNELSLALFENAAKIIGGERPLNWLGKELYRSRISGAFGFAMKLSALNPTLLIERAAEHMLKLNRVKKLEVRDFDPRGKITFRFSYPDSKTEVHENICDYNEGAMEGLISLWGKDIHSKKTKCVLKGDEVCEYKASWTKRGFLSTIFSERVTKEQLLREAYEELEQRHAENQDLILNLEKRIKERTEEVERLYKEEHKLVEELKRINKAKTEFISNISHRLKTPIAVVKNVLENTSEVKGINDEIKGNIHLAEANLDKLLATVENIITLGKIDFQIEEFNKTYFELDETLEDILTDIKIIAGDRKMTLDAPKRVKVFADEEKITELFYNLLDNAIKFTKENGKISINIKDSTENVKISVKDDGVGINKEELKNVFNRYYMSRHSKAMNEQGTGVGLAICKWIMEGHKGSIDVKSEPEKGTEFLIVLPKESK